MMPIAVRYNVGIEEFMDSTFREIEILIEARKEQEENQFRSSLMQDYQMVDLMAASLGRLIDKKAEYPKIFEIYPGVFPDEVEQAAKQAELARQQEYERAQWLFYVEQHNASLKKKKEKMEDKE